MIFRCSVTILLNGSSMTTAPVVSKRPCRTTLVMPPARSSVEMSMQHLPVGPPAPAQAVIAVFALRRNAETLPAQKISERFIPSWGRPPLRRRQRVIAPAARGSLLQCNTDARGGGNAEQGASLDARVPFPALIGTAR